MKKSVLMLIALVSIALVSAEIRINEAELNPTGNDAGNEWIEIYSDSQMNLNEWKLVNSDNQIYSLNNVIQEYLIINLDKQWLDNENESIRLYNQSILIHETPFFKDASNDAKTWSYCSNTEKWVLTNPTKGSANNCSSYQSPVQNNSQNNTIPTNKTNQTFSNASQQSIILSMDWNDNSVRNGKEFDIEISAFNLENKTYDIKVYIYRDNNKKKIISDTYHKKDWIFSNSYYVGFFEGPGNKTSTVSLRIRESYPSFTGDADIGFRIREKSSSSYKAEINEYIEILDSQGRLNNSIASNPSQEETPAKKPSATGNVIKLQPGKTTSAPITSNAIKLGAKTNTNEKIIYRSGNELIRNYIIFAFLGLLIIFVILLIFKRSMIR